MNLFKMKRGGGIIVLLMVTALILTFGACKEDERPPSIWDNYREYAIRITNNTKTALVAFDGELRSDKLLGGIPAGKTEHGLKNDPKFFGDKPKQIRMLFITEEQYNKNKGNLPSLTNEIFTQMFVFYNGANGDNTKVYEISGRVGGEYTLLVTNNSNYNVELRVDGPNGPTLGYAVSGVVNNRLYVSGGQLLVFPVLKRYNQMRDIMETIIPWNDTGGAWRQEYLFEGNTNTSQFFNVQSLLSSIQKLASGVAYLKIYNNTSAGAIGFIQGTRRIMTPNGYDTFSRVQDFVIEMPGVGNDFAEELQVNNYQVYIAGYYIDITDMAGSKDLTLKTDKMYTVYVTGDPNNQTPSPLKAVVELREGEANGPVDLDLTTITYGNN